MRNSWHYWRPVMWWVSFTERWRREREAARAWLARNGLADLQLPPTWVTWLIREAEVYETRGLPEPKMFMHRTRRDRYTYRIDREGNILSKERIR